MSLTRFAAVVGSVWLVACAADAPRAQDTEDTALDGSCAPMQIGRCGVAGSLADCTGGAGEEQVFVPIEEGDPVSIVSGFQGATMFAFALRAEDIDPGDPDAPPSQQHPLVELEVFRTSYSVVGRFRNWIPFQPAETPDTWEVTEIYVLLGAEVPVEPGQELWAEATLTDASGTTECGSVGFVAE